jgi:hypothetical protein
LKASLEIAAIIIHMGRGSNNLMYGLPPATRSRASAIQEVEEQITVFKTIMTKDWRKALAFKEEHSLKLNELELQELHLNKLKQELDQLDFSPANTYGLHDLQVMSKGLYQLQIESQDPLEKSSLASFLEEDNNKNPNLVKKHLSNQNYYLACALYKNARKTQKYIPFGRLYFSEQEKEINWTSELEHLLTERVPLELRQQIKTPEKDFKTSVVNLITLSIEQQVVEQVNSQLDFEKSKYAFAFGHPPLDRIIHHVPHNFGSKVFKPIKCSTSSLILPLKKRDLKIRHKMDFCSDCFPEKNNQNEDEFRESLQDLELERRDNIITSYELDNLIEYQIDKNQLLKKPVDQIKEQLLDKRSNVVRKINNDLHDHIKLMPKDLRKEARKMEITVWNKKIF